MPAGFVASTAAAKVQPVGQLASSVSALQAIRSDVGISVHPASAQAVPVVASEEQSGTAQASVAVPVHEAATTSGMSAPHDAGVMTEPAAVCTNEAPRISGMAAISVSFAANMASIAVSSAAKYSYLNRRGRGVNWCEGRRPGTRIA